MLVFWAAPLSVLCNMHALRLSFVQWFPFGPRLLLLATVLVLQTLVIKHVLLRDKAGLSGRQRLWVCLPLILWNLVVAPGLFDAEDELICVAITVCWSLIFGGAPMQVCKV